ncbi:MULTISPECIES: TetR/AcrR family transcriptional regulator [unclassified Rhodococcus (in: high G+C Gram-positive bacteria)]|uniref:TetR/AcrR family transcriptional regulator n=1 Tax=unclassified Rhodococcus (in: high G+C Gram-positive bacteria) TaxID=192944 RepID=UPI000B058A5B|nr:MULTISPECIES: TetR/AcrR family transcriptional regulator [unclassified Rhodococcus (in: high G+C Gram-positive bacteria)]
MTANMDPRAVRSRELLLDAAAELVSHRDPAEVSITDIASAAGVSRPTLYLHFQDRDTLFAAVVRRRLQSIAALDDDVAVDRDQAERSIGLVVAELGSNREFYRKLIGAQSNSRSREQVMTVLREGLGQYLRQQRLGDTSPNSRQSRRLDEEAWFITGGMVTVLSKWLDGDHVDEPSEQRWLAERLWHLLSTVASAPEPQELQ